VRRALAAAALAALLAEGCAGPQRPSSSGACPGSQELCLTGRDCTVDRARGCQLCLCRPADQTLQPLPGPAGARPEDRREPALPPLR